MEPRCHRCHQPIVGTPAVRDGEIFHQDCLEVKSPVKCKGCGGDLNGQPYVLEDGYVFHADCRTAQKGGGSMYPGFIPAWHEVSRKMARSPERILIAAGL